MISVAPGDMLEVIPRLVAGGVVCDAVVTDPPYGLSFMGMDWDRGVAFRSETWATVSTILRPGAFLIAFGGTRTYHRLVTAIEDAGFVIQDQVCWLFGSGFPKNKSQLKPAHEPIVLAYKPGGKRTMQVDECRIGADEAVIRTREPSTDLGVINDDGWKPKPVAQRSYPDGKTGRWPANVCLDDSEEVTEAFAAFGEKTTNPAYGTVHSGAIWGQAGDHPVAIAGDTGSAARFFYCAKAGSDDRMNTQHPTTKPTSLMRWLVKLVCPPNGLVLDPFGGSGTTAVACLRESRNCIIIEREEHYVAMIKRRLAHVAGADTPLLSAVEPAQAGLPFDEVADGIGSHNAAIAEIGRRVKTGEEPVPDTGYFGVKP